MTRNWQVGDRVTSIAVSSYPGVGVIEHIRFDGIDVRWNDGSWSQERPIDLIFAGRPEDPAVNKNNKNNFNVSRAAENASNLTLNNLNDPTNEKLLLNPLFDVVPMAFGSGTLESLISNLDSTKLPTLSGTFPNVAQENFQIYQEIDIAAMQPGAPIPMFSKGVIF